MNKPIASTVFVALVLGGGVIVARADGPSTATVEDRAAELFQRRAGRLVVESGQMVSDGRSLQRQGDRSLRRAEEDVATEGRVPAGDGLGSPAGVGAAEGDAAR